MFLNRSLRSKETRLLKSSLVFAKNRVKGLRVLNIPSMFRMDHQLRRRARILDSFGRRGSNIVGNSVRRLTIATTPDEIIWVAMLRVEGSWGRVFVVLAAGLGRRGEVVERRC